MRTLVYLLLMVTFVAIPVSAQGVPDIHQTTTAPSGARFEIIQSEAATQWTFRLDRFTGEVSQLATTKEGEPAWQKMQVKGRSSYNEAKYQISTAGVVARFTFLIDTVSGKSWQLHSSKKRLPDGTEQEMYSWEPFAQ
ncbi:MAG: hypothetical protein WCD43_06480 [Candidatus Acidiferrales bacterium]